MDKVAKYAKGFIPYCLLQPIPAQVEIQRSHWKGNWVLPMSKRNRMLLCWIIGPGIKKTGGEMGRRVGRDTIYVWGLYYLERVQAAKVDPRWETRRNDKGYVTCDRGERPLTNSHTRITGNGLSMFDIAGRSRTIDDDETR